MQLRSRRRARPFTTVSYVADVCTTRRECRLRPHNESRHNARRQLIGVGGHTVSFIHRTVRSANMMQFLFTRHPCIAAGPCRSGRGALAWLVSRPANVVRLPPLRRASREQAFAQHCCLFSAKTSRHCWSAVALSQTCRLLLCPGLSRCLSSQRLLFARSKIMVDTEVVCICLAVSTVCCRASLLVAAVLAACSWPAVACAFGHQLCLAS